jgi:hypothetical protein
MKYFLALMCCLVLAGSALLVSAPTASAEVCPDMAARPAPHAQFPHGDPKTVDCFDINGAPAGTANCTEYTLKATQDYHIQCQDGTDEEWCKCCKPKEDGGYLLPIHITTCDADSDGNKVCVAGVANGEFFRRPGGKTVSCPVIEPGKLCGPCPPGP